MTLIDQELPMAFYSTAKGRYTPALLKSAWMPLTQLTFLRHILAS